MFFLETFVSVVKASILRSNQKKNRLKIRKISIVKSKNNTSSSTSKNSTKKKNSQDVEKPKDVRKDIHYFLDLKDHIEKINHGEFLFVAGHIVFRCILFPEACFDNLNLLMSHIYLILWKNQVKESLTSNTIVFFSIIPNILRQVIPIREFLSQVF